MKRSLSLIGLLLVLVSFAGAAPIKLFTSVPTKSKTITALPSSVVLHVDRTALAQARASKSFQLTGLRMPMMAGMSSQVDLDLTEFSVIGDQTEILLYDNGTVRHGALPTVKTYKGYVIGYNNSLAIISLEPEGRVTGMIRIANETFTIGSEPKDVLLSYITSTKQMDGIGDEGGCLMFNEAEYSPTGKLPVYTPKYKSTGQKPQVAAKSATVAFDADNACYKHFNQNESELTNWLVARLAVISGVYESEVDCALQLGRFFIYTSADPYTANNLNSLLTAFRNHWTANNGTVSRTVAHLISRQAISEAGSGAAGLAGLGVLCSKQFGYGVTRIMANPSFPNVDEAVIAHEIGHNFGSAHTHNCQAYPPDGIDHCVAAEGGCSWTPTQVVGSIMSYCNQKNFSFAHGNDRRVIDVINQNIADATCLGSVAGIESSTDEIVFGKVAVDVAKDSTITGLIRSTGTVDLTVSNITVTHAIDSDFFVINKPTLPMVIPSGQSRNVSVRYKPLGGGERTDTLLIFHNAAGSPMKIGLRGTAAVGQLRTIITTLDFGKTTTTAPVDTTIVYIQNIGDGPLYISDKRISFSDSDLFKIILGGENETLEPYEKTSVKIRFTPAQPLGLKEAFFEYKYAYRKNTEPFEEFIDLSATVQKLDNVSVNQEVYLPAPKITITPNPFSGKLSLTIETLPKFIGEHYSITLLDLNGKQIASMNEGKLTSEQIAYDWTTPESLADGTYFVKISIGSYQWMRKVNHIR